MASKEYVDAEIATVQTVVVTEVGKLNAKVTGLESSLKLNLAECESKVREMDEVKEVSDNVQKRIEKIEKMVKNTRTKKILKR